MFNNVPPNGFPQIPDIEDLEAVVQDVTALKASKANTAGIAPAFSADGNYSVGDLVYYEGTLYKCTTAHEAAAWDAEDFTEITIAAETAEMQDDISDLESTKANQITIAPAFSAETAYSAGDIVYYNGLSYRCTNDHEGAWDAEDFAATTIANELNSIMSGLNNVTSKVPIRGAFTVACSAGQNIFNRSTMILVEGTIPTHSFAYCLFGVCNHGSSLDSPNTVESDGADSIIINAKSSQNIRIGWLDMTNIPFQTT